MDERATAQHAEGCCAPDPDVIEELAGTAFHLLAAPGVTRVRLSAGCHSVELECDPSTEPESSGAGWSGWSGVNGDSATAAGRHRRPS